MRLLLDTHTFIWFVMDSPRLSVTAKALIENEYNEKLLSIASIWEMAIKHSNGKLSFELPFMIFIQQQMSQNSVSLLDIRVSHVDLVANLSLQHHDPFDRLIIAQAIAEQTFIVGKDVIFDSYPIQRLW